MPFISGTRSTKRIAINQIRSRKMGMSLVLSPNQVMYVHGQDAAASGKLALKAKVYLLAFRMQCHTLLLMSSQILHSVDSLQMSTLMPPAGAAEWLGAA